MAIKISGTTVIDDSRNLTSIVNATLSGNLTVDTNSLYVDSTNNRVGVGTTTPSVALEVNGTVQSSGLNDSSGRTLVIKNAAGTVVWGN